MINQALSESSLAWPAVIGLVTFVAIFVGVAVWAFTRRTNVVAAWSSLPLADGCEPVEPRNGVGTHQVGKKKTGRTNSASPVLEVISAEHSSHTHAGGGCGKCEECDCQSEPSG